jgi:tetratricopeptide (TPR) repeat protein
MRLLRRFLLNTLIAVGVTLATGSAWAGTAEGMQACAAYDNPEIAELACTQVIGSQDAPVTERALAYQFRGYILRERGELARALGDYDSSIALASDNADAHHNRGYVLAALRRYPEAVEAFTRALALDPNSENTHSSRGAVYIDLNEFEKARPTTRPLLRVRRTTSLTTQIVLAPIAATARTIRQSPISRR